MDLWHIDGVQAAAVLDMQVGILADERRQRRTDEYGRVSGAGLRLDGEGRFRVVVVRRHLKHDHGCMNDVDVSLRAENAELRRLLENISDQVLPHSTPADAVQSARELNRGTAMGTGQDVRSLSSWR